MDENCKIGDMFNEEYYKEKKAELNMRSQRNKDWVIQEMTNILNKFWEVQQQLHQDFKEIEMREKSAKILEKKIS